MVADNPSGAGAGLTEMSVTGTVFDPSALKKEDFMPLEDALYAGPKSKKKVLSKEELAAQKKAKDDLLPTKGKPASFFIF